MLVRTLIAAAALVGLMATGAVTTTAFAQTSGNTAAAPAKPMAKSMPMKKAPMHKAAAKEGHKMDNIADKLNACETKAPADRQGCISSATAM